MGFAIGSSSARQRALWIAIALGVLLAGCASYRGARLYVSGSHALERGEITRAFEALERAARLVPQASEVQNHLGLAYRAAGQPERARVAFERALGLDCANAAARENLSAMSPSGFAGGPE